MSAESADPGKLGMNAARALRSPVGWTVGGMSVLDIAAAVLLSTLAIVLASGVLGPVHPKVSTPALIGVLVMIVPLAWRRRAPLAVAVVLVAATLLNGLIFGSLVRCGATLPVFFLVAFAVGVRYERARAAAGLALCAAAAVAEGLYDPQIGGQGLVFVLPVLTGFFVAGVLVRARTRTAQELRARSAELRRQREQTADLAVLADRARVSADLESTLHAQLGGIATTAATGLSSLDAGQAGAREALASIEHDGRAVLGQLRAVLGALHEPAPSEPPPTLARLSELLTRATSADARLTVEGSPRTLPAGLELSGYRIVEHLLLALDDAPGAAVDVRLRFCPDALELHVRGPRSPAADLQAALASARERAGLHGGTVRSRLEGRICHATATLPLVSGFEPSVSY
jgi:signal transduction histidine kinase